MKKVCILFYARVGSTYLCRVLNSHPEVAILGEVFNPNGVALTLDDDQSSVFIQALKKSIDVDLMAFREEHPDTFLARCHEVAHSVFPEKSIIGSKFSFTQNPRALSAIVQDTSIAKVFLDRRNLLAVFSSEALAAKTGVYHISSEKSEVGHGIQERSKRQQATLEFDAAAFQRFLDRYRRGYTAAKQAMSQAHERFLELEYEELFDGTATSKFAKHFELDDAFDPAHTGLKRVNVKNPLERFSNPDDVICYLEQSGHLDWLPEDGNQGS